MSTMSTVPPASGGDPVTTLSWAPCGARTRTGAACRIEVPAGTRCHHHRGQARPADYPYPLLHAPGCVPSRDNYVPLHRGCLGPDSDGHRVHVTYWTCLGCAATSVWIG